MSTPVQTAGLLTIYSDSASKSINLNTSIPKQVLRLKTVYVNMTSAAASLAQSVIYVDLPFFSASNLVDQVEGSSRFPIFLDATQVTHFYTDIPVLMQSDVPSKFQMRVYDINGALLTNMNSIGLKFSYELGFFR